MNGDGAPGAPGASAVLEVSGVTKSFPSREGELQVLRGIDLTVGEHQAVAVIGASGSGKSTLLRCIDLLEDIDDGDVFLDGEVITDPSVDAVAVRRRLGLVFQAYNLFPHLDVIDNVILGSVRAHALDRRRRRAASSPASASRAASATARRSCPAASSSASPSRVRSPPGRGRCCSTR